MSMNVIWLPARLGVTHRSRTSPSENWALPAPITASLTSVRRPSTDSSI